jgi:hypothetical protein
MTDAAFLEDLVHELRHMVAEHDNEGIVFMHQLPMKVSTRGTEIILTFANKDTGLEFNATIPLTTVTELRKLPRGRLHLRKWTATDVATWIRQLLSEILDSEDPSFAQDFVLPPY